MIIRSMNNEREFPEGTTVKACLEALDAFPRGTLAPGKDGVTGGPSPYQFEPSPCHLSRDMTQ